jgi:hypothetical protein
MLWPLGVQKIRYGALECRTAPLCQVSKPGWTEAAPETLDELEAHAALDAHQPTATTIAAAMIDRPQRNVHARDTASMPNLR